MDEASLTVGEPDRLGLGRVVSKNCGEIGSIRRNAWTTRSPPGRTIFGRSSGSTSATIIGGGSTSRSGTRPTDARSSDRCSAMSVGRVGRDRRS